MLLKRDFRQRLGERLGRGLAEKTACLSKNGRQGPVIWVHALSVGEVTSALPLVSRIKQCRPRAIIVFSATTRTGRQTAERLMQPHADLIISAPLDIIFIINKYIKYIKPALFIQVETDFWPNWLLGLKRRAVPTMLVNGRISAKSFRAYQKFGFFFKPMFRSFSLLSMQTGADAEKMVVLGMDPRRVVTLGNLKYDTPEQAGDNKPKISKADLGIPTSSRTWICGSTHEGEEEIILEAYLNIRKTISDLVLLIAPRDINRADAITELARKWLTHIARRSTPPAQNPELFILDTIGELSSCYRFADLVFIGGSLVDQGGHNPLEAAAYGVPVLFGPHMEDFLEIGRDLRQCGGAEIVASAQQLAERVKLILQDQQKHRNMSVAAAGLVAANSGVVKAHLGEMERLISRAAPR